MSRLLYVRVVWEDKMAKSTKRTVKHRSTTKEVIEGKDCEN